MELEELSGKHIFSGIEIGFTEERGFFGNCIKFELDGKTYIATEDPDDGYRSYMNELEIDNIPVKNKIPEVHTVCKHCKDGENVLEFIDIENGKTFLTIGTRNIDDYYPYCVFEYTPENIHYNER